MLPRNRQRGSFLTHDPASGTNMRTLPALSIALVAAAFGFATTPTHPARAAQAAEGLPYQNPSLPLDQRVNDLVSRMTLEEKVSQMTYQSPAIERLGVPQYNWWNEALHGVARAGVATVFPQAIGLAATFDPEHLHEVASVIGDEARAKHHEAVRQGKRAQYYGLTFWSPNINIFRDPRWGRGQETYGEDPYLTGQLAVAFVRGLQGDDPRYRKVVATLKHFAVHSGPEPARHGFDARISLHDLRETYLEAFRTGIIDGKADSVMGAYNRVNGVPCCADPLLLTDILRREWGFRGYVTSDCGAITDIYRGHHFTDSAASAAAAAVKAGDDLECGRDYRALTEAVRDGLIRETEIDVAVKRLFTSRFRLGMFDPPSMVPYAQIPYSVNDSEAHRQLAARTARESMVLLKNEKSLLPLRKELKSLAVIGPNADSVEVLLGNYNGDPSHPVTPLAGLKARLAGRTDVKFARGCELTRSDPKMLAEAVDAAKGADAAVLFLGLSPRLEGEEMRVDAEGFRGGDRTSIDLPKPQQELLRAVSETGKPVVLVLLSGSALAVNWADANVPAIVQAWYPGEEAGTAIADVLFGDYNPAGRLPVTFYRSVDQLPPFESYAMKERTYRYFTGSPLYPFGHGLSYTHFRYRKLTVSPEKPETGEPVQASVEVRNAGKRDGDEVVQLYVSRMDASGPVPIRSLAGVQRIPLKAGERRQVTFTLTPRQLAIVNDRGERVEEAGDFEISVGGKQPHLKGTADASTTETEVRAISVHGSSRLLEK